MIVSKLACSHCICYRLAHSLSASITSAVGASSQPLLLQATMEARRNRRAQLTEARDWRDIEKDRGEGQQGQMLQERWKLKGGEAEDYNSWKLKEKVGDVAD